MEGGATRCGPTTAPAARPAAADTTSGCERDRPARSSRPQTSSARSWTAATVRHALEREPLRGRQVAGARPIARRQDPRDVLGRERPLPHPHQRADHRAHHLVQERVRPEPSTIRSPSREMVTRSSRRTVALPSPGCRQNDVKSCSPTRCRAAVRIAGSVQTGGPVPLEAPPERIRHRARCRSRTGTPEPAPKTAHGTPRAPPTPRRPPPPAPAARSRTPGPARASVARTSRTTPPAPVACTPASVRPATASRTSSPSVRGNNSRSTPSTVRTEGSRCAAHPRNAVPSYARSSRIVRASSSARRLSQTRKPDRRGEGTRAGAEGAEQFPNLAGPAQMLCDSARARPTRSAPSARRRPCAARASGSACSRPDVRSNRGAISWNSSATTSRSGMSFSTSRRAARSPFFAFVISFSA